MDKDYKYWNAHKAIYNELLNELDNSIIMKITTNPNCAEAHLLNKRVDKQIQESLKESTA
jgi:succinate dehydrogenase flavin-adding protein (antitoxin of CptAB toxin-antitoxin module)